MKSRTRSADPVIVTSSRHSQYDDAEHVVRSLATSASTPPGHTNIRIRVTTAPIPMYLDSQPSHIPLPSDISSANLPQKNSRNTSISEPLRSSPITVIARPRRIQLSVDSRQRPLAGGISLLAAGLEQRPRQAEQLTSHHAELVLTQQSRFAWLLLSTSSLRTSFCVSLKIPSWYVAPVPSHGLALIFPQMATRQPRITKRRPDADVTEPIRRSQRGFWQVHQELPFLLLPRSHFSHPACGFDREPPRVLAMGRGWPEL